jgi:hypothetical protein
MQALQDRQSRTPKNNDDDGGDDDNGEDNCGDGRPRKDDIVQANHPDLSKHE